MRQMLTMHWTHAAAATDNRIMTNTLLTTVRDELRERREARAHEQALRRELSGYTSPARSRTSSPRWSTRTTRA